MSTLNLASPWEEVKEKLKEVNSELTDEDLQYQPGGEDELLQRLSKKMNKYSYVIQQLILVASFY